MYPLAISVLKKVVGKYLTLALVALKNECTLVRKVFEILGMVTMTIILQLIY